MAQSTGLIDDQLAKGRCIWYCQRREARHLQCSLDGRVFSSKLLHQIRQALANRLPALLVHAIDEERALVERLGCRWWDTGWRIRELILDGQWSMETCLLSPASHFCSPCGHSPGDDRTRAERHGPAGLVDRAQRPGPGHPWRRS